MPSHTLEELLAQRQELFKQQQALQDQGPAPLNLGLLNSGQQSIGDAFANPDAAQVSGLLGAIAGLVNPQGDAPVGTAAVNALTNFAGLRQQDQKARQARLESRGKNLKDQLANIADQQSAVTAIGTRDQLTQFNASMPQSDGSFKTEAVQRDKAGNFFDIRGNAKTLPIGTRLTSVGKTEGDIEAGGFGLTKQQTGQAQKRVLSAQKQLREVGKLTNNDLNKFLSVRGRATTKLGSALDFAQGLGGEGIASAIESFTDVNPVDFAASSRVVFERLESFFNENRKDITGAAAAFAELQALKKGVLNGQLPPAQAIASLSSLLERVNGNIEADLEALDSGVSRKGGGGDAVSRIRKILDESS